MPKLSRHPSKPTLHRYSDTTSTCFTLLDFAKAGLNRMLNDIRTPASWLSENLSCMLLMIL
ncbi:hypothetical protein DPMN_074671 [Dreissena polymorpha]|uniref:Uncharacterized protein n=1 Tax=Dreissena polymorpha TaxID=45954 RepID=A0A9D3YGQ2_DREPO|nr:hypothetical protein DPMN_074671 [Dreissena polymorpha]